MPEERYYCVQCRKELSGEDLKDFIDWKVALDMLNKVRDTMYDDLIALELIKGDVPREACYPLDLWQVIKQKIEKEF